MFHSLRIVLFLHILLWVFLLNTSLRPGMCILACHSDLRLHHVQVKVLCVNATPHSTFQTPQMPTFTLEQSSSFTCFTKFHYLWDEMKVLILIYIFMKGFPFPTSSLHFHLLHSSKYSKTVMF